MTKIMKVAKIISTKQIVINAGSNDGLKVGDKLEIVDRLGATVKDPDTGKVLGTLDMPKGKVIVSAVYEKMAVADAPDISIVGLSSPNSTALGIDTQEDLNVDPTQITGNDSISKKPIQIGDIVIKKA